MGIDSKIKAEMYDYIVKNWARLKEINGAIGEELPLLALPELVDNQFKLHYHPHVPSDEAQEKIGRTINSCLSAAVYFPDYRTLVVHLFDPIQARKNLAHELVHAAFNVKGSCRIYRSMWELEGIKYQGKDIGRTVFLAAKRLGIDTNLGQQLDFNEFFVPLGLAHLGEDYHEQDWLAHVAEIQESSFDPNNQSKVEERIGSFITHLPQIAGEKLLDQNGGKLSITGNVVPFYYQQANHRTNEFWLTGCMPLLYGRRFQ